MAGLMNVGRQAGAMNPRRGRSPDESVWAGRGEGEEDAGDPGYPAGPDGRGFGGASDVDHGIDMPKSDSKFGSPVVQPDRLGTPGRPTIPAPGEDGNGNMSIADKTGGGLINKAPAPVEPPDMTNRYNTALSPEDEAKFKTAYPDDRDTRDYDMRGAWKAGVTQSANGHYPDTYKKPSHPTFSTESQYNGVDGHQGGQWTHNPDDSWHFDASKTNIQMHGKQGIQDYFNRTEPGITLSTPEE